MHENSLGKLILVVSFLLFRTPNNRMQKHGRTIHVRLEDARVERFKHKMDTAEAKAIYRQRSRIAEFPHAWLKCKPHSDPRAKSKNHQRGNRKPRNPNAGSIVPQLPVPSRTSPLGFSP